MLTLSRTKLDNCKEQGEVWRNNVPGRLTGKTAAAREKEINQIIRIIRGKLTALERTAQEVVGAGRATWWSARIHATDLELHGHRRGGGSRWSC